MDREEVHDFALRLIRDVWEPFDSAKLADFYHQDVVGHHRSQTLSYLDIENRLTWDQRLRGGKYDIQDILMEEDRFSIRFTFTGPDAAIPGIDVMYFYHLRDGKIAEFWLMASFDFDYK